ncbi:MAG: Heimdall-CTERM domain-containing surface protein [Candidatus Hodarchaeota archaeon]
MTRIYFRAMLYGFFLIVCMTNSSVIAASPAADTITWHSSVKNEAVFGWKITNLAPNNPAMPFDMGGQTLVVGDPIFFKYTNNPPTDPAGVYEATDAPDYIDIYIKESKVSWAAIAQQSVIFMGMIVPIEYTFENDTTLDITEIIKLGAPSDFNVNIADYDTYVNATFSSSIIQASYKITRSTGVASELSVTIVFYGSITWEYDSSLTLPEDTEESATSSEGDDDNGIPGFELLPLFAGLGLLAAISIKKRRN